MQSAVADERLCSHRIKRPSLSGTGRGRGRRRRARADASDRIPGRCARPMRAAAALTDASSRSAPARACRTETTGRHRDVGGRASPTFFWTSSAPPSPASTSPCRFPHHVEMRGLSIRLEQLARSVSTWLPARGPAFQLHVITRSRLADSRRCVVVDKYTHRQTVALGSCRWDRFRDGTRRRGRASYAFQPEGGAARRRRHSPATDRRRKLHAWWPGPRRKPNGVEA
ncbi:hypothetical protein DFJ74DRAFT_434593 [Hyaloraphidium curvatum]|nr:hypothetical protein DFJ74DRAFT_434593 [Hyaloraphidium curvatum]